MKPFDWKLTTKMAIFQLKLLGLWPINSDNYELNLYSVHAFIILIIFVVGHNFSQSVSLYLSLNDLAAFTAIIFVFLTDLVSVLKAYYVVQNIRILKSLVRNVNCEVFQPKSLDQVQLIQTGLSVWRFVYYGYWTQASMTFFFWATFPILDKSVKDFRLPFIAWYPFSTRKSPEYELTYLYQIISVYIIIAININVDMLIGALNVYIASQCDLLCDNLRQLKPPKRPVFSGGFNERLLTCIRQHKEILSFARDSNRFFNWVVLTQFFSSAVSIGLTLFQLTIVVPLSSEFYSFIFYGTSMVTEIFVYCWFGNEVEIKSTQITYSTFESNWIDAGPVPKKNLYYFMIRCERPIKMSALNLFYLTLDTFMKICRTSWSYFAVLKQVNV